MVPCGYCGNDAVVRVETKFLEEGDGNQYHAIVPLCDPCFEAEKGLEKISMQIELDWKRRQRKERR